MKRQDTWFALAAIAALTFSSNAFAQSAKMGEIVPTVVHSDHAKHGEHGAHQTGSENVDPQVAIPLKLKAMFETPDKPLSVAPVVVADEWAIAGWVQDGRGGRALLKRKDTGWSIHLCSGDSLKQAEALVAMGLSQDQAKSLSTKLAQAEMHIDTNTLALFASFEGTVMVEGDAGHSGHADHGK